MSRLPCLLGCPVTSRLYIGFTVLPVSLLGSDEPFVHVLVCLSVRREREGGRILIWEHLLCCLARQKETNLLITQQKAPDVTDSIEIIIQYIRGFLRFAIVPNFLCMIPNFNLNLTLYTTQPMNYSAGMHPEPFLGPVVKMHSMFCTCLSPPNQENGKAECPVFQRGSESGTWLDLCLKSKRDSPRCLAIFSRQLFPY